MTYENWITTQTGYTSANTQAPPVPNERAVCKVNYDQSGCDIILGAGINDVGNSNKSVHKLTLPFLAMSSGINAMSVQCVDGNLSTSAIGRLETVSGSNIATVHPGLNDITWNVSSAVSRYMLNGNFDIKTYSSQQLRRNIIFEGTSIQNFDGAALQNQFGIPFNVLAGITTGHNLCFNGLCRAGSKIIDYVSRFTSKMQYLLEPAVVPHIIFVEAPTNDIANRTVGYAQIYSEWKTYIQSILATGATVIVCTMIARLRSLDTNPNVEADRIAFNAMVLSDVDFTNKVADVAALPQFDSQSDCNNTSNYIDGVHLTTTGQLPFSQVVYQIINLNL